MLHITDLSWGRVNHPSEVLSMNDSITVKVIEYDEEKKKQQASKKKQHVVKVKEIRVRPRIDTHDLETKVNLGRKFIRDGCKLKVTLMYRGRELSRTDLGLAVLAGISMWLSSKLVEKLSMSLSCF